MKLKLTEQTSEITKAPIETSIDPCDLGVGVSTMKDLKECEVKIKCNEDKDKKFLGVWYYIIDTYDEHNSAKVFREKPQLKMYSVPERLLKDENRFLQKLVEGNALDKEKLKELKIVRKYDGYQEKSMNIFFEMDKETCRAIIKRGIIRIGWNFWPYYSYDKKVNQCSNCWRYGHFSENCEQKKPTCMICAGEHTFRHCKSEEERCTNCEYICEVLGVPSVDYKHYAQDKRCPTYMGILKLLQEKKEYSEMLNRKRDSKKITPTELLIRHIRRFLRLMGYGLHYLQAQ